MQEVQGSGDDKQEFLKEGFVESSILEEIPQACQVKA